MAGRQPTSLEDARALAAEDLAVRLGHRDFSIAQSRRVTWRDASMGCPQPGHMYPQVLTPGYLIVFEAGGRSYRYHGGSRGAPRYCPPGAAREPLADNPEA